MSVCVCVRAIEADGRLYYNMSYITVTWTILVSTCRTMHEGIYSVITPVTALQPAEFLQHLPWDGVTEAKFEIIEGNTDGWLDACFQTSLNWYLANVSFFFSSRNLSADKTSD